jgi:solute carrier family 35 protein F5
MFCFLWFFANFTTNTSLAYTTVGSSTILSSMSGLFTLAIGALFKVERLNLIKFLAVIIRYE